MCQAKPGEVEAAVFAAIEAGYRHIDCAYGYGNEKQVGQGIQQAIDQGIAKREDLFIVSKVTHNFISFCLNLVEQILLIIAYNVNLHYNSVQHVHTLLYTLLTQYCIYLILYCILLVLLYCIAMYYYCIALLCIIA